MATSRIFSVFETSQGFAYCLWVLVLVAKDRCEEMQVLACRGLPRDWLIVTQLLGISAVG